jgi:hypothetical protein
MATPSISVGELMEIGKLILDTISGCITAAKDKLELHKVLTDLQGILSLIAVHTDQYILYPKQLEL